MKLSKTEIERAGYDGITVACEHDFSGGLCSKCLCPETPEDNQRAFNAIENMRDLMDGIRTETVRGGRLSREDAVFEAWRSHRRQ